MADTRRELTDEQQAQLKQIVDEVTQSYDRSYLEAMRDYWHARMRIDEDKERAKMDAVKAFFRDLDRQDQE